LYTEVSIDAGHLDEHYLEFNVRVFNGAPAMLSIQRELKGFILFNNRQPLEQPGMTATTFEHIAQASNSVITLRQPLEQQFVDKLKEMFAAGEIARFMFHELRISIAFGQDKSKQYLLPLPYGVNCRNEIAVIGRVYTLPMDTVIATATVTLERPTNGLAARPQKPAPVKLTPNIETLARLGYVGQDKQGIFRHDRNVTFQAAIIEFLNKTIKGRQVPSFEHVKAHILFTEEETGEALRVNAGTWMKVEYNHVSLRAGESRELIIALSSQTGSAFLAVENEYEDDKCFERLHLVPLKHKIYRVDVELVDMDGAETIGAFRSRLVVQTSRPYLNLTQISIDS
jgi:hypothetical protein